MTSYGPLPDWRAILREGGGQLQQQLLDGSIGPAPKGRYEHWEKLRHRTPPRGFTPETWWAGIKLQRHQQRRDLPMADLAGQNFGYVPVPQLEGGLHRLDSRAAGRIAMPEAIANPDHRDRYLVSSLIEEAVTSSQLEGAATTRRVAVDMLRAGRAPRDVDETMIFNNYRAMETIRQWREAPITPERVLELHRILTEDTLDDPDNAGRIQQPGEKRVAVWDDRRNRLLHQPPPAQYLEERMAAMCRFANQRFEGAEFLHPLIQAVVLHFWLAWDHPFVDGNGRTARALFYWQMLKAGYWLFEFLSISTVIRQAPVQYQNAFLDTETDDNDLTYFLLHQLSVIDQAMATLEAYLQRKHSELQQAEQLLRGHSNLNSRQLALLSHALRHPDAAYTIRSHQRSHNVAYATARSDLFDLVDKGLLMRSPAGIRPQRFTVPPDLTARVHGEAD